MPTGIHAMASEIDATHTKNRLRIPFWVFLIIAVLYFSAARVDLMDIDATQYAEISREMALSNDFLHVYDHGRDYLDKPPMLFWTAALSMKVLGPTPFAYRLPSILVALLGIFAIYRLTRLLYDEETGRLAALVLASCQGFFLWTNDVRTDMMLTGFVATALWCIRECEQRRRWYFVLGGTAAIAAGMMTKGPIALFVPVFAFGADWLLHRDWKRIFSIWHLFDLLLIVLFLVPMCIGLYQQFDMHPEKWVNGSLHNSGLKFFFWTQSFGRITGASSWDNGAGPFFLLNTMSWAFLPWILLFLTAMAMNFWTLVRQRARLLPGQEWLSTGGFLLTYLALCTSHYQLPHYILVAFPLAAVVVAKLLVNFIHDEQYRRLCRVFASIQTVISLLLLVAALAIISYIFPAGWFAWSLWVVAVLLWILTFFRYRQGLRVIWISVVSIVAANVFLTHYFYYPLLQFQAGSQVGPFIREQNIPAEHLWAWRVEDPLDAIHFYSQRVVRMNYFYPPPGMKDDYLLMMRQGLNSLDSLHRPYQILREGRLFKVSELTPQFLNPNTRDSATKPWVLVRLL